MTPLDRALFLSRMSAALSRRAREHASAGRLLRAQAAKALAEAFHHHAGGDHDAAMDAAREARWLAKAAKKREATHA